MVLQLESLLAKLITKRVADLYLLPTDSGYRLLANQSGRLSLLAHLANEKAQHWISNLKFRANMAVSEHRRPQAGAIHWHEGQQVDLRLSSVGDYNGRESLVVRFIYELAEQEYRLLLPDQWRRLKGAVAKRGMVLFAGPTGSGKTTTMYRLAAEFKAGVVMTIEDPVEIREPAFLQLQVNRLAGMDYQDLLRVGLRHRPQVFIIGEIRDGQTAQMAVQAALSGHLVLATGLARTAPGVLARLQQLGVEPYYLFQTLSGVCYQRLLPTDNGQLAVLFDLLLDQQLVAAVSRPDGGMSDEWQNNLAQAVCNGQITAETSRQFQNG